MCWRCSSTATAPPAGALVAPDAQACLVDLAAAFGSKKGFVASPPDQAAAAAIALVLVRDHRGDFAVQADVQQLLLNLISNASDATGPGGTVSIRAARQDGSLEVVVEDTGCGIPREHLAKIQEPFFTTKANGHGLGLAICRSSFRRN